MYDLEEQEQIDALKSWWRQNGRTVIVVAAAAVLTGLATMGWRHYRAHQSEQASQVFAELEKAVRGNNLKQVRELSTQLADQYGRTKYASLAALMAAKLEFDSGDLPATAKRLEWAAEHAADDETRAVARLRLAGVRLDEKKYDEALKLIEQEPPPAFVSLYADLKGDVLLAQGKTADARGAYQRALEKLPPGELYRALVQAKLDGLGAAKP